MRLITIPFSHFCEKARWAADHHRAPYREEPHLPVLHLIATKRAGGGRTVPVLAAANRTFADSTEILHHFESTASPATRLYPEKPELRRDVDALEELFDVQLGPATRLYAYYHLLPEGPSLLKYAGKAYRPRQRLAFRLLYPVAAGLIRRRYRISPERATQKLAIIRSVFDQVAALLSDGRPYLAAGRFTAADLTFASLAAPVLMPTGHPAQPDDLSLLPTAFATVVADLRSTPAGIHAQRMYDQHRR